MAPGGYSIGYFDHPVFPLRIGASDVTKPSSLHVKVGYAVCREICLPAQADLELALSGKTGAEEPQLIAVEIRVPRRVPLGAGAGIAIRSVSRENSADGKRAVFEVAAAQGAAIDLFVEGPVPGWTLPLPHEIGGLPRDAYATRQFTFRLDGMPPGAKVDDATSTFTAFSPGEVTVH